VHRNKILHNKETYQVYLIDWHVRMQKLNIKKSEMSYIRLWNETTVKMMKNAKKEPVNNIRNYFSIR